MTSVEEAEALAGPWSELADQCGARATSYPWWCLPWWQTLGRGRLRLVVVEDGSRLVGLGPFYEQPAGPLILARFLGQGYGTVARILSVPEAEPQASLLIGRLQVAGRRYLHLTGYEAGPRWPELLAGPRRLVLSADTVCSVVKVEGSFETYWATRHKELRRTLRRAEQGLLEREVTWQLEVVTDEVRLEEVLGPICALYDRAEAARARVHLFRGSQGSFTRQMLAAAAVAGRLRLFLGWAAGSLVSFDVGLLGADSLAIWLGRIHPDWRDVAPGHLAMRSIVRHAFDTGVGEVDLMMGLDWYKRRWCNERYDTLEISAARSRSVFAAGQAVLALRPARSRLRAVSARRRRPGAPGGGERP